VLAVALVAIAGNTFNQRYSPLTQLNRDTDVA
jgi:hypothetical protein